MNTKPTKAFSLTSIAMPIAGITAFCIGLMYAEIAFNEKRYYFAILIFGLFSFVSLQKTIRDKLGGLNISKPYCWISSNTAIVFAIKRKKGFTPWRICLVALPLLPYKRTCETN